MALIEWDDLLNSLVVEPLGADRFTAPNVPMDYRRIFGGQLLAQAVVIAAASTDGKQVKSLHALLPREGDLAERVEWRVERLQEGRSFAARSLVAAQGERVIFQASVSLHVPEASEVSHQAPVPSPSTPETAAPVELSMLPWTTHVAGGVDLADPAVGPPELTWWMRTPVVADDPTLHQALFAHASDLTLIGTALRPHPGLSEDAVHSGLQTAVTTHTLWFHDAFRVDEWLRVDQESPRLAGGRGFGWGHARAGGERLVASFAQESLVRSR